MEMHWMVLRSNEVGALEDYFNSFTIFDELHFGPEGRIYGTVVIISSEIVKMRRLGWEVPFKNSIYSPANRS